MLKYLRLAIVWMGLSTALLLQQSVADDCAVADV